MMANLQFPTEPSPEQPAAAPALSRLILVRHGETTWNAEQRIQGQLDAELSPLGREQAVRVAGFLSAEPIAAIYSSDLSRARETAAVIGAAIGVPVQLAPGFREAGFGEWEGLTVAEIRERFAEEYRLWREDAITNRPPGGETIEDLQARAVAAARAILTQRPGETVLIVAHGGPVRTLVCGLLELPLAVYPRLRVDNGGITRLAFGARGGVLASFNETGHLR
jgi:broad specificity phosphatase PhoE